MRTHSDSRAFWSRASRQGRRDRTRPMTAVARPISDQRRRLRRRGSASWCPGRWSTPATTARSGSHRSAGTTRSPGRRRPSRGVGRWARELHPDVERWTAPGASIPRASSSSGVRPNVRFPSAAVSVGSLNCSGGAGELDPGRELRLRGGEPRPRSTARRRGTPRRSPPTSSRHHGQLRRASRTAAHPEANGATVDRRRRGDRPARRRRGRRTSRSGSPSLSGRLGIEHRGDGDGSRPVVGHVDVDR